MEPAPNQGKNYITPGGIEILKAERHFLLTKDGAGLHHRIVLAQIDV